MCSEPRLQRRPTMQCGQVLPQTPQVRDTVNIHGSFDQCASTVFNVHCTFRDLQFLADYSWLPHSVTQPIVKRLRSTGDVDRYIVLNSLCYQNEWKLQRAGTLKYWSWNTTWLLLDGVDNFPCSKRPYLPWFIPSLVSGSKPTLYLASGLSLLVEDRQPKEIGFPV